MKLFSLTTAVMLFAVSTQLDASAITITSNNASYSYNIPQTPGGAVTASINGSVNFGPGESDVTMTIWLIAYGSGSYSLNYQGGAGADGYLASYYVGYQIDTVMRSGTCQGSCTAQGILTLDYNTPFELMLTGYANAYQAGEGASYNASVTVSGYDPATQLSVTLLPFDSAAVPEPSTFALTALAGLGGFLVLRRKQRLHDEPERGICRL